MLHIKSFNESGPKGKDLFIFVRFGGLDLKTQKGFGSDTFHAPPATRGFYAMPKVAQEMFLVGSIGEYQPGSVPKYRETGEDDDYSKWEKRYKRAKSLRRKEFRKDRGDIWHHLGEYCRHSQIIETKGSWVKTDISDWAKAFSKMSINDRYGEDSFTINSINTAKGINGFYSKDHCEVFFDEKV